MRTDDGANLRVTRLAGAASRLMLAYQQGLVTLDRLRAGGKQTIIVQHVQVNEGGQAVVAGKVKPGAKGGGRGVAGSGSPSEQAGRTEDQGGRARNDDRILCTAFASGSMLAASVRRNVESTMGSLPQPGDDERALSPSRREEHRTEDARGCRTGTASRATARVLYGSGEGGTADCTLCSRRPASGFGDADLGMRWE